MNYGNYERKAFKNFCYFYYIENCVERHNEQREIYKNKFRYIRANWKFLNREWKNKKDNWLSMGEVS